MLLLLVFSWATVAGLGWVGYQLVRQNGRILLQLSSLEAQMRQILKTNATATIETVAPAAGLEIGSSAPPFDLPDLAGNKRTLADWAGQPILLIFFNPGCGFCVQMAPELAALPGAPSGGPVPVLISTGSAADNQALVEQHGIPCPMLSQRHMEVASSYRVSGTPMGYLVDAQGRIASAVAVGAQALLALAGGEAPAQTGSAHEAEHERDDSRPALRDLSHSRIKRDGLSPGTPAPEFTLPSLDGTPRSLGDFRGARLLLIFSDPGCGPCQELAAKLKTLDAGALAVRILIVSRGDPEANRAKALEHRLPFPIVLQRQWEISRLYAMFATPVGYLIDEHGIIASNVAAGADAILSLLAPATAVQASAPRTQTAGHEASVLSFQ